MNTNYKISINLESNFQSFLCREEISFGDNRRNLSIKIPGENKIIIENIKINGKFIVDKNPSNSLININCPEGIKKISIVFCLSLKTGTKQDLICLSDWYPIICQDFGIHGNYIVKVNDPTDCKIYTSGIYEPSKKHFKAENIRSFGVAILKGYNIFKKKAQGININILYKEGDEKIASIIANTAIDSIKFYREFLGFYPYKILTIILTGDKKVGGVPVATNLIKVHGKPIELKNEENYWKFITAHEIAHHYWGELVVEKNEPAWLWIALGLYLDNRYFRAKNMDTEIYDKILKYYTDALKNKLDTRIINNKIPVSSQDYNNAVLHGKGLFYINLLSQSVGFELFEKAYKKTLNEYMWKSLGYLEFKKICEEASGKDLDIFFKKWMGA